MRRKCANLATAATDTMRRSMFREIHATDEAVDGDADSPTDGAVVACLMFPSMQRSSSPAAKHTKRHFNKKNEKKLQNICTIQKPLPPLQRQKIIRVQAKIYAVFPRVCRRNSAHPATLFAGDSGKENGFFVNILKHKEND